MGREAAPLPATYPYLFESEIQVTFGDLVGLLLMLNVPRLPSSGSFAIRCCR